MIHIVCSTCEQKLKVKDKLAGRMVKCPKCQAKIAVPESVAEKIVGEETIPSPSPKASNRVLRSYKQKLPQFYPALLWNCFLYPLAGIFRIIVHMLVVAFFVVLIGTAIIGPYNIFPLDSVFLQAIYVSLLFGGAFNLLFYIPLVVLTHGILITQYHNVIVHSADGEPRMPLFDREIFEGMGQEFSALVTPFGFIRMLGAVFSLENFLKYIRALTITTICFLPLFAYGFLGDFESDNGFALNMFAPETLPYLAMSLPGMFLYPLALLAVSLHESLSALHPRTLFRPLKNVLVPYCLACAGFYLPLVLANVSLPIAYQERSLFKFLAFKLGAYSYLGVIAMHVLGGFYWCYSSKIGWFSPDVENVAEAGN